MTASELRIVAVPGLPEIGPGDDLAELICGAVAPLDGDVVVVAQKVVSKAEGAFAAPSPGETIHAARRRIAHEQATEIVADAPRVLVVRTAHGLVCANAGIDASNVTQGRLTLLPDDPDDSAARLRAGIAHLTGVDVAVIITDTFGRPWREGHVDVAIGVAGLEPVRDERGSADRHGLPLTATQTAVADEIAAAADLVRAKADGVPVVIVRGLTFAGSDTATAADLIRAREGDLFGRGRGMLSAVLLETAWPSAWDDGIDQTVLQAVRAVTPDARVVAQGPPIRLLVEDPFSAGLAAAVLADADLAVRWRKGDDGVILEAGRAARPR